MLRHKSNMIPWCLMGLTAVLVVTCLIGAIGVSYARFTDGEDNVDVQFGVRQLAPVYLGIIDEEKGFIQEESAWQTQDGQSRLSFAVSNGGAEQDQCFLLRIIGSLGTWSEDPEKTLTLTVEGVTYTAAVSPIVQGTALYAAFGDGWVFRFLDVDGNELNWNLEGGALSYTEMTLCLEGEAESAGLLQLQIVSQ